MPENRQTLLFSATFPPNLQSMLPSILRSPYFRVEVGKALTRMRDETAIRQVGHFSCFHLLRQLPAAVARRKNIVRDRKSLCVRDPLLVYYGTFSRVLETANI